MTVVLERPTVPEEPKAPTPWWQALYEWVTSLDHKVIGKNYLVTSLGFFIIAGFFALTMRTQLAADQLLVNQHTYNELFTMHGSFMMYLFAGPFAFGAFANYLIPLQIGATDMAFPRLNALSYWVYLFGGLIMVSSFLAPGGAPDFGWVSYAPLSTAFTPGLGPNLWILGIVLVGISGVLGAVNILTTVIHLRAPGMSMFRCPLFVWNMVVTAVLELIAFPTLAGVMLMLYADRNFGTQIFSTQGGGVPVLYQNVFWFFGHPEVYILALPYFGIISEIIPVFSRKPIFGYRPMIFATFAIAALSSGVWAHHMFTTGTTLLPFFSAMSFLIAVPTGIKFFNWIFTMWRGALTFPSPMLFAVGFMGVFLFGGMSGVLLASPPIDFFVHDTYFVVAHFHEVLIGTAVFAGFAGFYFWYPKATGRMLREGLAKAHFWVMLAGVLFQTIPWYVLGLHGMPRRLAIYPRGEGWLTLNQLSSFGAYLVGVSFLFLVVNLWVSWRKPVPAGANPWGYGQSLEWVAASPPPAHNFDLLPPIRSGRPAWDQRVALAAAAGPGR